MSKTVPFTNKKKAPHNIRDFQHIYTKMPKAFKQSMYESGFNWHLPDEHNTASCFFKLFIYFFPKIFRLTLLGVSLISELAINALKTLFADRRSRNSCNYSLWINCNTSSNCAYNFSNCTLKLVPVIWDLNRSEPHCSHCKELFFNEMG